MISNVTLMKSSVLPVLFLLGLMTGCKTVPPPVEKPGRLVVAHYFNWFQTPEVSGHWRHWEWRQGGPVRDPEVIRADGLRDICSVYYPLIGPYDSASPEVMEYHILLALAAKLDGFVLDWYGMHSMEDERLPALMDMALRFGFKVGICFEDKAMFGYHYNVKDRREAVSNAIANLNYIFEKHAAHPAYLKLDGVPVIVNFNWQEPSDSVVQAAHGFSAAEWAEILAEVRKRHAVYFIHDYHCHLKESYWDVSDNLYPWLDVNGECLDGYYAQAQQKLSEGKIDFISTLVYPGFDNTGVWGWGDGPFVTPREDGAFYARSWERALENDARVVQVATWNDFGEGATIEPSVEYGFKYLEMTEAFIARFKGVASDEGLALQVLKDHFHSFASDRRSLGD